MTDKVETKEDDTTQFTVYADDSFEQRAQNCLRMIPIPMDGRVKAACVLGLMRILEVYRRVDYNAWNKGESFNVGATEPKQKTRI
jgi:hypothetical protein